MRRQEGAPGFAGYSPQIYEADAPTEALNCRNRQSRTGAMRLYPKYATTVIGAHSVPDWYESLDRLVSFGQLSMAAMADAQYRAGQAAVLDQELAGIDVVTGGEMHRRTHNRHAPPNAMLNFFWQRIPAFQGSTRPKPITPKDPDVFHPAATCRTRIGETIDLGLVDEFKTVSALTRMS